MQTVTIGMAHHEDFSGAYFSIQHARMVLGYDEGIEYLVVDQSPKSRSSEMLRGFLKNVPNAKYVQYTERLGTSASRNKVFEHASGDVVCCIDCHVLLEEKFLHDLSAWGFGQDLWQGPIMFDTLTSGATHFDPVWQAEMFGVWGQAWQCPCGGWQFGMHKGISGQAEGHTLAFNSEPSQSCPACGKRLPSVPWEGHEGPFSEAGYLRLGFSNGEPGPFEIPGQGLGMFACRRDAWLGFNEDALGFGGEELYIHEKFRQAGRKAWCHPAWRWAHRFGREMGVKYPLTRTNKIRNYILEFNELGLPLDPIKKHFVDEGPASVGEWDRIMKNPKAIPAGCQTCGKQAVFDSSNTLKQEAKITDVTSLSQAFDIVHARPRDLDQHMPILREYASKVDFVGEISGRAESTMAFLAAEPEILYSVNTERDPLVERSAETFFEGEYQKKLDANVDLVFFDTVHTYDGVLDQLRTYKSRRFIILHDTQLYGEIGTDKGPGVMVAVREFMKENPQWSVIHHTPKQYGLTILGCQDRDKPSMPGKIEMAANFMTALGKHTVDGLNKVEADQLEERLNVCMTCEQRNGSRCAACGCVLETKAAWRTSECPLGRWPSLPD